MESTYGESVLLGDKSLALTTTKNRDEKSQGEKKSEAKLI